MGKQIITLTTAFNIFLNKGIFAATSMPWWVQSTLNLVSALTSILILLSGGVSVFVLVYRIFCWYQADQNERPAEGKKIKYVIIGAIAVILAESIIKWVLSFYVQP